MQRSERLREAHTLAPITNARLRGLDKCFYPEPCMWGPNRHDIRWNEVARERAAAREQMNRGRFICRKSQRSRCHPMLRNDRTKPLQHTHKHILVNGTKAPPGAEPPPILLPILRYRYLLVFGRRRRARNLASSALLAYHRTLRFVLEMRFPLATAVKSIWYTG